LPTALDAISINWIARPAQKDGRRFHPPTAPKARFPGCASDSPRASVPRTTASALWVKPWYGFQNQGFGGGNEKLDNKTGGPDCHYALPAAFVSNLPPAYPATMWARMRFTHAAIHTAFFAKRHWRCHTITGPDNTQGWGSHRPQEPRATDFYPSIAYSGTCSFVKEPTKEI